jgi:hypothetical protein
MAPQGERVLLTHAHSCLKYPKKSCPGPKSDQADDFFANFIHPILRKSPQASGVKILKKIGPGRKNPRGR